MVSWRSFNFSHLLDWGRLLGLEWPSRTEGVCWNRPLGRWILKFQRKNGRSPDADNVKVELWIYVSLFMRTYTSFSSFDTLTTRYFCTLNAKLSVIANLNILHGQYFSLFSRNLSTVWQATRVLLKRVVEHLTEPHLRDLLFRFLLDSLMDEFLCNAQTKLVELNAMRDKSPVTTNH